MPEARGAEHGCGPRGGPVGDPPSGADTATGNPHGRAVAFASGPRPRHRKRVNREHVRTATAHRASMADVIRGCDRGPKSDVNDRNGWDGDRGPMCGYDDRSRVRSCISYEARATIARNGCGCRLRSDLHSRSQHGVCQCSERVEFVSVSERTNHASGRTPFDVGVRCYDHRPTHGCRRRGARPSYDRRSPGARGRPALRRERDDDARIAIDVHASGAAGRPRAEGRSNGRRLLSWRRRSGMDAATTAQPSPVAWMPCA